MGLDGLLLPLLDFVHGVDRHQDIQEQVVPHVDQASNLRDNNPDDAEPPGTDSMEEVAEEVSRAAAEEGSNDMMNGLSTFLHVVRWSRSHLNPEVSVLQILPGKLNDKSKGKANAEGDDSAHEKVENDAMENVHEAMGIKHVLEHPGWIPFRDPDRRLSVSPDQHCRSDQMSWQGGSQAKTDW